MHKIILDQYLHVNCSCITNLGLEYFNTVQVILLSIKVWHKHSCPRVTLNSQMDT